MAELVTDEILHKFHKNGFVKIPGFLSCSQVAELKAASIDVIQNYCSNCPVSVFGVPDRYYAESGDKIRGFYEPSAIGEDGKVLVDGPEEGLALIGNALHILHPTFHRVSKDPKVREIISKVTDIEEPTIFESILVLKNSKVGGRIAPHQDSASHVTEPLVGKQTSKIIGFWIALDGATEENGCMQFLAGSHKFNKLFHRVIRNPDEESDIPFLAEEISPFPDCELVSCPALPGDLILIDGLVVHSSPPNMSDKPRWAYSFHLVDGTVKWSDKNRLQDTQGFGKFMRI